MMLQLSKVRKMPTGFHHWELPLRRAPLGPKYDEYFRNATVTIYPDNDEAGRIKAEKIASALYGIAKSIKIVTLPGLDEKGDVSDYLDAGHTVFDLDDLWGSTPEYVLKPQLESTNLDLEKTSQATWDAIVATNEPPKLFRYGGNLSRIELDDEGSPHPSLVTANRLRFHLGSIADWYGVRKSDGEQMATLPPKWLVDNLLAHPDPPVPVLRRIVYAPLLDRNGELIWRPGFHRESGIYYHPTLEKPLEDISETPNSSDVDADVDLILDDLFGEFPFVDKAGRAHALSLLLEPFVRDLIEGPAPFRLIHKPMPGTGGSLLADVATFPALGTTCPTLTEARDEDSWRKRLTAKLLTSPTYILIDNVRHRIESSALSAAITATVWEDRRLTVSEMVRVPVRCGWVATGNNPAVSNEISRRTIPIRLDAKIDRPWLRDGFKHPDLREWARENRHRVVWSALTLARAWIARGKPSSGNVTLGMFEHWSRVMGGILEVGRVEGFLANLAEFYDEADAESAAWRIFVERWWDFARDREVGVSELYRLVIDEKKGPLDLDLPESNERSQKISLGKRLHEHRDRQFGIHRIVMGGTKKRAQQWKLIDTTES